MSKRETVGNLSFLTIEYFHRWKDMNHLHKYCNNEPGLVDVYFVYQNTCMIEDQPYLRFPWFL